MTPFVTPARVNSLGSGYLPGTIGGTRSVGRDEIPPDQVEEARLVQLEQLRRFHLRGTLPDYTEDTEDLELLIEITADRTRFAQVCDDWRWAVENPPRRLDLPPGAVRIRKPSMSGSLIAIRRLNAGDPDGATSLTNIS